MTRAKHFAKLISVLFVRYTKMLGEKKPLLLVWELFFKALSMFRVGAVPRLDTTGVYFCLWGGSSDLNVYSTGKSTKTNTPVWSWKWFSSRTTFCATLRALCYVARGAAVHMGRTALLLMPWTPALDMRPSELAVLFWQYHCTCTRRFFSQQMCQNLLTWFSARQWSYLNFQCWDRRKGTLWPAVEVLAFRRDAC